MINLYPWNVYILIAAAIITVIVMIQSLKPLLGLKKTAESLSAKLETASKSAETFRLKAETIGRQASDLVSTIKKVIAGYLVLSLFQKSRKEELPLDTSAKPKRRKLDQRDLNTIRQIGKMIR